jgi:hypothetical protein
MKTKNTTLREQFHNRIKNIVETHVTLTLMGLKPLSEIMLSYQYNDKHSHTRSSPLLFRYFITVKNTSINTGYLPNSPRTATLVDLFYHTECKFTKFTM